MGVYIWNDNYSAMQGPAPDGFHVPSKDEWTAVYNVWTALGGGSRDGANFGIALKLPFAGLRSRTNSNVANQGSYGDYWSSTIYNTTNNTSSRCLLFYSGSIEYNYGTYRAIGMSIRPFKDEPVIPDNSRTTIYSGTGSAGIFHNAALGLISISSDGTNWITTADKNLGATTVWNNGDTLSESNCGYYYQWGNNYGFAWTGTLTNTSTTQVNASSYGPGNYYNSSTFIKYEGSWDSSNNANLRGGVTGVNHMSELKNAYIGEYRVPGENTVLYLPLESDTLDHSSNNVAMTNNNVTISNGAGYFNGSTAYLKTTDNFSLSSLPFTVSVWLRIQNYESNDGGIITHNYNSGSYRGWNVYCINKKYRSEFLQGGGSIYTGEISNDTWYQLTITANSNGRSVYLNGQLAGSGGSGVNFVSRPLFIGTSSWVNSDITAPNTKYKGYISNLIIENKARTAQEIANYYNQTKANYGL